MQSETVKCLEALRSVSSATSMIENHRRPDGRAFDQIRPITIETGVLPRTHGSALFTRGETQALVTMHAGHQGRRSAHRADRTRRIPLQALHAALQFPAVQRWRDGLYARSGPQRNRPRGARRARALSADPHRRNVPLYHARGQRHPRIQRFELAGHRLRRIAGADGCRRTAGRSCGGIAMGLVMEGKDYAILTDIAGAEDHYGDMDFRWPARAKASPRCRWISRSPT